MKIKAYRLNDNTWLLVDPVGDEGQATVTAKDERGIKAQLADVAVITYGWHRPEIVLMSGRPPLNAARNAAGYVDASSVVLHPGDAVVFKTGYRSHSNDDEWLERNGDTVREVRGDEVKIGPSANDWAKIKDLMVWHNAARSRNAVVQKALNARAVARNIRPYIGDRVTKDYWEDIGTVEEMAEGGPSNVKSWIVRWDHGGRTIEKVGDLKVVQKARNATARNGAMAALDSSEKSKIKSIASGMPCSFMDGGDSLSGVIKHSKRPFLYIDFDVSKSEIGGKPYYEWYVHAWNRTRKWERNGGQYKIEDAVSAAAQAMRGAKQMIEKWAGGVPLNADTSVLRETSVNGSDDAILRLCKPSNIIQRGKTENLHEVRYGGGYIYPVVSRDGVLTKVYGSLSEANRRTLNAARKTAVNGSSSPWGFFVGEEVVIKRDPEKKKHRIKEIVGGDIILEGVGPRFDASELDTANHAGPYRTTNAVVAKALNARWRVIYKNLSGPLYPYGKETYSTRAEAEKRVEELRRQSKEWGSNTSYFVDEV